MSIEIRQSDVMTDEEQQHCFGWGDNIFGTADLHLTWRPKDLHFFLSVDGRLASHAALLKHTIEVNGSPVTVAGLGGVVTLPWAQRNGYAGHLVSHAMTVTRAWDVDAGLLFCIPRMVPYYARMRWEVVEAPVMVEQPGGVIQSPLPVMVLPVTERLQKIERIDLKSPPW